MSDRAKSPGRALSTAALEKALERYRRGDLGNMSEADLHLVLDVLLSDPGGQDESRVCPACRRRMEIN